MKKALLIMVVASLLLAGTAFGQGVKGKMMISGYGGYTIGMGDAFDDYEGENYSFSTKAGITFGGMFHYGLTEKIMLGGEAFFQSYKFESEYTGPSIPGFTFEDADESETKLNFGANALYAMSDDEKKSMYLTAGVGFYDFGDTEIGFNGGFMYSQKVSPTVNVFVMPRIHIVMADDMFELIQIVGGVSIPLGAK